jgi:hypothetical protein
MMFTQELSTRRLFKSLQTHLSNKTIKLQIYLSAYGVTAYCYSITSFRCPETWEKELRELFAVCKLIVVLLTCWLMCFSSTSACINTLLSRYVLFNAPRSFSDHPHCLVILYVVNSCYYHTSLVPTLFQVVVKILVSTLFQVVVKIGPHAYLL